MTFDVAQSLAMWQECRYSTITTMQHMLLLQCPLI